SRSFADAVPEQTNFAVDTGDGRPQDQALQTALRHLPVRIVAEFLEGVLDDSEPRHGPAAHASPDGSLCDGLARLSFEDIADSLFQRDHSFRDYLPGCVKNRGAYQFAQNLTRQDGPRRPGPQADQNFLGHRKFLAVLLLPGHHALTGIADSDEGAADLPADG